MRDPGVHTVNDASGRVQNRTDARERRAPRTTFPLVFTIAIAGHLWHVRGWQLLLLLCLAWLLLDAWWDRRTARRRRHHHEQEPPSESTGR